MAAMLVESTALPSARPVGDLEAVHQFTGPMPTGVTVSRQGRIFVNYPKWGENVRFTVAEIRDGAGVVYPDQARNSKRRMPVGTRDDHAFANAVKGAIAGAAGVWLMDLVSTAMYEQEPEATKKQEEAARIEGKDPASVAATRLAHAAGINPTPEQEGTAATVIHYALGVVPGALYGVLRPKLGDSRAACGLAYGLALFLLNDEALGPALGLANAPTAYPWQAHARGLTAHLVLGVATDALLNALDRVA